MGRDFEPEDETIEEWDCERAFRYGQVCGFNGYRLKDNPLRGKGVSAEYAWEDGWKAERDFWA